jgi:hypothetical protein
VAPLAARAIWITPSTTLAGGRTITVTLTFASGGIGGNWGGSTYQSGTTGTLAATNTFAAFGTATNDEIVLVIGNTTYNLLTYFNYTVTCS